MAQIGIGARCLLAASLVATAIGLTRQPVSVAELGRRCALARSAIESPTAPERAAARLLRALPGLGERRAQAVAEARWQAGGDLPLARWTVIDGIGEGTVEAVRAAGAVDSRP